MGPKVLVVDDEPDMRRLLVLALRRRGYTVLETGDGFSALEIVRRDRPDVIVLDIMMPKLSGLEVAEKLKGDPTTVDIPILMLSAKGNAAQIEAGLKAGADAYMVKPFVLKELTASVDRLLAGGKLHDER